jgi:hypothetical protein
LLVVWSQVAVGGQSNGSTHSSYLGLLHPEIGRVALLAGPNDGAGDRESEGDAPVDLVLTSVTSDQPDDGLGDGHTSGDVQEADLGTADLSFSVRSERAGVGPNGRTHTATYTATDGSGNQTVATGTVHIAHDQ